MTDLQRASRRRTLWSVVIVLCALAPYVEALAGDFVWTDHHFVEDNRALQSWANAPRLFVTDAWQVGGDTRTISYYRPIRNLTLLVDTKLYGTAPAGYQFTNLVFHGLCSLLVFGVVRRTFGNERLAGLSAVLFAVHPIHVETVAWIIGRTDSCAALGYLFGLYAWLRAYQPDRTRWVWWSLGCLGAVWALLSKESAATLPVGLALCLWFRNSALDRRFGTLVVRCAPAAILTAGYLLVRGAVLTNVTNHPLWGGSVWSNALTAISLLGPYTRMLVTGGPLIAVYEEHVYSRLAEPAVWLGLGVISAVLVLALQQRRAPAVAFGAAWIAATSLPVLHVIPFKVLLAERFMYLPSLGWCVMLAGVLVTLSHRATVIAAIAALVAVVGYAQATVRHVPTWATDFTLFADSLEKAPNSPEAVMGLARAHYDADELEPARDLYVRATTLSPNYYLAWYNLGLAHARLGSAQEALAAFQRATETNAEYTDAWWALGRAAYATEDVATAERAFRVVADRRPTQDSYLYWGRALARNGQWVDAAGTFLNAIGGGATDPHFAAEAANALVEAGQDTEAVDWFTRARSSGPVLLESLTVEATDATAAGETGHAAYIARVATRLAPDDVRALRLFVQLSEERDPVAARKTSAAYTAAHPEDINAGAAHVALLLRIGPPAQAAAAARSLVTAHAGHPLALALFARERQAVGDLSAASTAAQEARRLAPADPQVALLAGEIALELGDTRGAIDALEGAQAHAPDAVPVLRRLGQAYRAAGRPEDAARVLERGLSMAPNDSAMLALLDAIQRSTGAPTAPAPTKE